MREGEKRKGRIERSLSLGVAALVFLMLAFQFAVFLKYIIEDFRDQDMHALHDPVLPVRRDTVLSPSGSAVPLKTTAKEEVRDTSGSRKVFHSEKSRSPASRKEATPAVTEYDGWKWDMVELNSADSAALDALPWIGPYYAREIIRYREKLWGSYADVTQLMDIRGIDRDMFEKFSDRVYIDAASVRRIDLYSLPEDSLAIHPYIGPYAAKGICRYRSMVTREGFTLQALVENGILPDRLARRLSLYEPG